MATEWVLVEVVNGCGSLGAVACRFFEYEVVGWATAFRKCCASLLQQQNSLEDLGFVLQQQPVYLARLLICAKTQQERELVLRTARQVCCARRKRRLPNKTFESRVERPTHAPLRCASGFLRDGEQSSPEPFLLSDANCGAKRGFGGRRFVLFLAAR